VPVLQVLAHSLRAGILPRDRKLAPLADSIRVFPLLFLRIFDELRILVVEGPEVDFFFVVAHIHNVGDVGSSPRVRNGRVRTSGGRLDRVSRGRSLS